MKIRDPAIAATYTVVTYALKPLLSKALRAGSPNVLIYLHTADYPTRKYLGSRNQKFCYRNYLCIGRKNKNICGHRKPQGTK